MNVVVIGTGFGARVVAPVFAATAGCTVVDVVSPREPDTVRSAIARPGVDLVSVHAPPFLHATHVREALGTGRAVLCDKPFGLDAIESTALLDDASAARVVHLVNFEFRYDPARVRVRDLVRSGAIGTVEHMSWTHFSAGSRVPLRAHGWLFDSARGGGWIGAWASHAVDTVHWLLGESGAVTAIDAVRRMHVTRRPDRDGRLVDCTAEDGLAAWLTLAGAATVAFDSTFAASATVPPRIVVTGTDGVLECIADERVVLRPAGGPSEVISIERGVGADRHRAAMRAWAEVVRDAVHAGVAPEGAPTFADGLACARVLDRLRAAPLVVRG